MTENLSVAQEALFKTLAVMTNADTNVQPVEVEMVQQIFKDVTGIVLDDKEVHMASKSEFIEDRPIEKYLSSVEGKLNADDKILIMQSLAKIVKADDDTRPREAVMFDQAATALKMSPSDLAGL